MSKLVIAIVHQDDAEAAAQALRDQGHRFTRFPTVGGFLSEVNTTFVMGVDDASLAPLIGLFEEVCHSRDVEVPLVLLERLADWKARTVTHGGATLLIADLSAIVHI